MTLIRKLFYGLLGFLLLLGVTGLFIPDSAHIERSITINAPPATIFPYLNGMKAFHQWSPWKQLDPDTHYRFSGPETGIGSKMTWASGEDNIGQGSQTIISIDENASVGTRLVFGEDAGGEAHFYLREQDKMTRVTWSFDTVFGWDIFSRYVGLFLDDLLGPSYEQGLINLKALVEDNL